MSTYRVEVEKTIVEYYIVEADSEEAASAMAKDGLMLTPEATDEIESEVMDVEIME